MQRRSYILLALILAATFAALAAGIVWLTGTSAGLAWSLVALQRTVPELMIDQPEGTWARGFSARRVTWQTDDTRITAHDLRIVLAPAALLRATLVIEALAIEKLDVLAGPGNDEPLRLPPDLGLPLPVEVEALDVATLVIDRAGQRETIERLHAVYAGSPLGHQLRTFRLTHALGTLEGKATLQAGAPHAVEARLAARLAALEGVAIDAHLAGPLERLAARGRVVDRAASIDIDAMITPFAGNPLERVDAAFTQLNLRSYDGALPHTGLTGKLQLAAQSAGWSGALAVTNAVAGRWDDGRLPFARFRAGIAVDARGIGLTELRLEFAGTGRAEGEARLTREVTTFALRFHEVDLRALHGSLRTTRLAGDAKARLRPDEQQATLRLAQDGLAVTAEVIRRGDDVRVPQFIARARGSTAAGAAQLRLEGARPFTVTLQLDAFDPAAWGDFPAGRLHGAVTLAGDATPLDARLRYAFAPGSRLRDAALEGSGRLHYAAGRASDVDVQLAWGGNRLRANGAYGARGDRLTVVVDAARLALLDPRLAGRLSGSLVVAGTVEAPVVQGRLQARDLVYGDVLRAGSAALDAQLDATIDGRVRLEARDVRAAGWDWREFDGEVRGNPAQHAVTLAARGSGIVLAARARGGWKQGTGWSGVLESASNTGDLRFALVEPVAVQVQPADIRIGPVIADILGGRLHAEGLRYRAGTIDTTGRYTRLPVRALAALAGVTLTPRDDLRLNGRWTVRNRESLAVSFLIERDGGDLALPGTRELPLGLTALRLEGNLAGGRLDVRGTVKSTLATGELDGRIDTQTRDGLPQITSSSPLALRARLDVARLAPLAPFIGTTAHVDGRLTANIEARGTLTKPALSGTINAERLILALPPEGIELRDGTLRADLADNHLLVRDFVIRGGEGTLRANGSLALGENQNAALDWRAERLMLLSRPDRRLVVSGGGRATLEAGKLALRGALRADQGHFQFGTATLPTLGPDVIVAGRAPRRDEEAARLARTTLELDVDFGNDLHLVGEGLDAWINGRVTVTTSEQGELRARGKVATQRGSYTAFGQRLQIDRGEVLFNGALDNPGLDIIAMRKNQAVEAGVAVTGTVRSPVVRIVSEPAVPEGEALSWLMLGRSPADASRADLSMLPLAAAALFGKAQPGAGSIANRLGVDTLAIRGSGGTGGAGGTLANQVVAVGKRVSNRLYLIYEQGLGGTANLLKIEYSLTRRLLLRAETGEVSAAGLFFRHAFD